MSSPLLFPRVIDNTMRSAFVSCPHSFFRRHVQGLTRPGLSVHLVFGAAYAAALEAARKEYFHSGDTRDAVKLACEVAIATWGDFEVPTPTSTRANKTLASLLLSVQDYFREYPLDEDTLTIHSMTVGGHAVPTVEFSGAVPIPGCFHPDTDEPLLYTGRFDMIGARAGKLWGLDDKTAGALGAFWRNQWRLRAQFTGYCWISQSYGLNLDGFVVRGCAPLKTGTVFEEVITPRPQWMIETWLRQLIYDVSRMIDCYNGLRREWLDIDEKFGAHAFPQNFDSACTSYSGCQFLDLCASEHPDIWLPSDVDATEGSDFIISHWNPLTRGVDVP